MNRRSLLQGIVAMAAMASCAPQAVPAAQEKIYPRAALSGMWPIVREMRGGKNYRDSNYSLEQIKDAIMQHFESYGITKLPAKVEGYEGKGPTTILSFVKVQHIDGNVHRRELLIAFEYPGEDAPGPHMAHIFMEAQTYH